MPPLKKLNNKSVQGDNFVVTVPNTHEVLYREGDRTYSVEIEGGNVSDSVDWLVYSNTLTVREPAHTVDDFSFSTAQEILQRISNCLNLLRMTHRSV